MKITDTKVFSCAIAHRLWKYDGRCANVHGHNYKFEVSFTGENTAEDAILMDFGDIKKIAEGWIDSNWDHAVTVHPEDKTLWEFLESEDQRRFMMPKEFANSTAENMASFLLMKFNEILRTQFRDNPSLHCSEVVVWETDTAKATARYGA